MTGTNVDSILDRLQFDWHIELPHSLQAQPERAEAVALRKFVSCAMSGNDGQPKTTMEMRRALIQVLHIIQTCRSAQALGVEYVGREHGAAHPPQIWV